MESTGRYHLEFASQAQASGLVVYVLDAMEVHHYAKAMGQRGKTDPLDEHLIAQYVAHQLIGQASWRAGARQRLRPWQPTPALLGQLRDLLKGRVQLSNNCAPLGMALEHVSPIEEEIKVLLTCFDTLKKQIDAKVAKLARKRCESGSWLQAATNRHWCGSARGCLVGHAACAY